MGVKKEVPVKALSRWRRDRVTSWVLWVRGSMVRICSERTGKVRDVTEKTLRRCWKPTRTERTNLARVKYLCPCCAEVVKVFPSNVRRAERRMG